MRDFHAQKLLHDVFLKFWRPATGHFLREEDNFTRFVSLTELAVWPNKLSASGLNKELAFSRKIPLTRRTFFSISHVMSL